MRGGCERRRLPPSLPQPAVGQAALSGDMSTRCRPGCSLVPVALVACACLVEPMVAGCSSQEARASRSTGVCAQEARVTWDDEEQREIGVRGKIGAGVGVSVCVFVGVSFGFDFEVGAVVGRTW